MLARNRARYLAPIALAAAIAGTYVIVHAGLTTTHPATHSPSAGGRPPGTRRRLHRAKFYVVSPQDNLTGIAVKTGIPLATLEALNPNVDPNSLQPGQRVRLRR